VPLLTTLLLGCPKADVPPPAPAPTVDLTERRDVVDTLATADGTLEVHDPYRWLEDADSPEVTAWTEERNADFAAFTDPLPIRTELYGELQALLRYDDATVPVPCLLGTRTTWSTKRADQDKWVVHVSNGPGDPGRVVVDPNTWEKTEQLAGFWESPDCRYAVVGKARGGDENAELTVLDLDTLQPQPDTFRGWKHGGISWRNDNSGFWYTAKPTAEEKPDGEHFYWHRVWWHTLGSAASADTLAQSNEQTKESYHGVYLDETGRWQLQGEWLGDKNKLWLLDVGKPGLERVPVAVDMDAQHRAEVVDDKLLVVTNWNAPKRRLMVADVAKPGREHWKELIPEGQDTLLNVAAVGGRLFATYAHDVATRIVVYGLDGKAQGEIPLPTLGTASVSGYWSKPEVRVHFASFGTPSTVYTWDPEKNALTLLKAPAIPVDPALLARIAVDQVWFHSKDGTAIPMFVVHDREAKGPGPVLLTGYGGFDNPMAPQFGTTYLLWVERGAAVAIPSLRGGGEYGKAWHEAGMFERKQNVFDDFLGAAQWLIDEGWTTPKQLAISGGSNGGLLVSAAVVQRPDLFGGVLCSVPLTDMLRYHQFGLANIWSTEYGSADNPAQVAYLRAYSPYHNVVEGANYPPMLIVGSANDARTDPAHARKFFAAAQWADADHGATQPILLWVRGDSGHHGGVTIDVQADQLSRTHGFLMHTVGLDAPKVATETEPTGPAGG
jgi:prolyl oligopeptidase